MCTSNCLWVDWMRGIYLKNQHILGVDSHLVDSYTWKLTKNMKHENQLHIRKLIGNGRDTSLWSRLTDGKWPWIMNPMIVWLHVRRQCTISIISFPGPSDGHSVSLSLRCSSSHEDSPNGNIWGIPYAPTMFGCGLATNTHAPPLLPHLRLKKLLDTDPSISTLVPSRRKFANGAAAFSIHLMNRLSYSIGQVLRRT